MKLRSLVCLGLLSIIVCCGIVVGAAFAVLHSPSLLNRIANALEYEIGAESISLSRRLAHSISGVALKRFGIYGAAWPASNVAAKNSPDIMLRGGVDSLVLQNLKLTFQIGKETTGALDLSFLEQLPNVRRLEVQNAEILVTFEGGPQQVKLTDLNLTVQDYSAKAGGSIAFQGSFAATAAGDTVIAASGKARGHVRLAGVRPRPHGEGTVELVLDSARYTSGSRALSLTDVRFVVDLAYDPRTETVAITELRGESKDFGSVTGAAKAVLHGEMPWNANLSVAPIDFARVFAVVHAFLPKEYRAWTAQGAGAIETRAEGKLANDQPSLNGSVTLSFTQGGFSSPDGTRAAQGVSGALVLDMTQVAPEQKLAFTIRAEQRGGEYLWGTYYANLAGRRASLSIDGHYFLAGARRFDLTGMLDFFQTGDYSFSATGTDDDWAMRFTGADVSHARIVETLLKGYLAGLSPDLANLSVTGSSSLEAALRREGDGLAITGMYRTNGASLVSPDVRLSIRGIVAEVPFALRYPSRGAPTPPAAAPGFVRFQTIQSGGLTVESLRVPLVISENRLDVPEPIAVPFFGGRVHVYGLQIDDVLFPSRYRFGVMVDNVDLGRMTQRLAGIEYPGTVNADLGMMRYQNSRLDSEGKAVIAVFGGEIEATDLFAENIASASRKFGGDIAFRNISLEELTRKIAVGKITGIIQGSLTDFVMEYGEPASFILEVESIERRGVAQSISTDAIQSISILGTGADNPLNRGITQFFREYPYSKIGLRCVLKNDRFSVNGTIRDGGKEYLVRRGLLRGVDVVNQNPNNVIRFRDMEERIKRIYRKPQAEPGGITVE